MLVTKSPSFKVLKQNIHPPRHGASGEELVRFRMSKILKASPEKEVAKHKRKKKNVKRDGKRQTNKHTQNEEVAKRKTQITRIESTEVGNNP